MKNKELKDAPLGKKTSFDLSYSPSFLFPFKRLNNREAIGVPTPLPFEGYDIWNAYEISWLNLKGKPQLGIGEFYVPCTSECIVESKSLKLYLNSFNQSHFSSLEEVQSILEKDLTHAFKASFKIDLRPPEALEGLKLTGFQSECIDDLDIEVTSYEPNPTLLKVSGKLVKEDLHSHLIKSNCLVTGQPDWGSVFLSYEGPQIDRASLLQYFISFRNYNEFAEQFVERVFMDITRNCHPTKLAVYARYTRRGGIDINPVRSNFPFKPLNNRTPRQ